jgi:hypothetical protein
VVSSRLLPNIKFKRSRRLCGLKLYGTFPDAEQKEGSNVQELLMLNALYPAIAHLRMDHLVNNEEVAHALGGLLPADTGRIFGGSRNLRMQALSLKIDDICIQFNIDRCMFWVPRNLNMVAD